MPKPKLAEWSTSDTVSHHTVEKLDSLKCGKENMEMIPYPSELLLHVLHTILIVVFGVVRLNILKKGYNQIFDPDLIHNLQRTIEMENPICC